MPTDVIMPRLGLTMEAGTVQRWLAGEGQQVKAGEALLEVETDKVVIEVESPATGTLRSMVVREGETVLIGTVIARIYAPGEQPAQNPPEAERRPAALQPMPSPELSPHVEPSGPRSPARIFSSPRARKRAREAGLNWRAIPGTGPLGRVIERDVARAAADDRRWTTAQARPPLVQGPPPRSEVSWEPPAPTQRVTGGQLAVRFSSAPHFYLSADAGADALLELRERLLPAIERRAGVPLTTTDLLVKIAATALVDHPRANACWDPAGGGRIRLQQQIHIGVAVATDSGLAVPVLHNPHRMGLVQIASERSRLVQNALAGSLSPSDLEGGALTLTDLGMHRVDVFQAILNPPKSVMLAAGRIVERPIAIQGQVSVRPILVVTLTCDARVLDGALAAQFLDRVVELIEEPYGLIA